MEDDSPSGRPCLLNTLAKGKKDVYEEAMKKQLITLFICFLFLHSAKATESFQTAASTQLPLKVQEIIQALKLMNETTEPVDVKDLRKNLGNVKIEIDLYCPLFSENKYKDVLKLREQIDLGYEILGQFKDLYDTEVSAGIPAELEDIIIKRQAALQWRASFNKFLAKTQVLPLLSHPASKTRECLRPPKLLWARLKTIPSADDSLDEVLEKLVADLIRSYEKDQKKLLKIDHLFKYSDEERFHDFRKGVRTVLKLIDFYPQLAYRTKIDSKVELEKLIDQFGSINDLLVAYHKASGDKKKKLKEKIEKAWKNLQVNLEQTELDRLI